MRQIERRRVRKLLDAVRTKKIKLSRWEIDFLWGINNFRKKNEDLLSEKQEETLTKLWDRLGKKT